MNLFLKGEIMSMAQLKYKRVLLKISGEALAGDKHFGFDFDVVSKVCDVIKKCTDMGVQMGVVIGGGNFWRGVKNGEGKMARSRADHMGMLATVMNCLAVSDVMEQKGIPVRVQTAVEMSTFAEHYTWERAVAHLEEGKVVLFGAGSGCPYFSTDTAAVLRAAEIGADAILLAKNIDGVYSADPHVGKASGRHGPDGDVARDGKRHPGRRLCIGRSAEYCPRRDGRARRHGRDEITSNLKTR